MAGTGKGESNYYIIDACCLINFYATGKITNILESVAGDKFTTSYIIEHEALYVHDADNSKTPIDLSGVLKEGVLKPTELIGPEYSTFLDFTEYIHDGEAECASIAHHRGYNLVTDDKSAIKKIETYFPNHEIKVTSGFLLIKEFVIKNNYSDSQIENLLIDIRDKAKFIPWDAHEYKSWWEYHFSE